MTTTIHTPVEFGINQDVNTDMFTTIIHWLEDGAPHKTYGFSFDMSVGVRIDLSDYDGKDINTCGTSCCIAGAVTQFSNPEYSDDLVKCMLVEGDMYAAVPWYIVAPTAMKTLGITGPQAHGIFHQHATAPNKVAENLRAFLKDGKLPPHEAWLYVDLYGD